MPQEDIVFNSVDKTKLHGRWRYPMQATKLAVLYAHDLGGACINDSTFNSLSLGLESLGIASFQFDLRAHGQSQGKQEEVTVKDLHLDLDSALHQVINKGYRKIAIVAFGFGASIAVILASVRASLVASLCLWYPILNFQRIISHPRGKIAIKFMQKATKAFPSDKFVTFGNSSFRVTQNFYQDLHTIYPHLEAEKINRRTMYSYGLKEEFTTPQEHLEQIKHFRLINVQTIKDGDYGFKASGAKNPIISTLKFIPQALSE